MPFDLTDATSQGEFLSVDSIPGFVQCICQVCGQRVISGDGQKRHRLSHLSDDAPKAEETKRCAHILRGRVTRQPAFLWLRMATIVEDVFIQLFSLTDALLGLTNAGTACKGSRRMGRCSVILGRNSTCPFSIPYEDMTLHRSITESCRTPER